MSMNGDLPALSNLAPGTIGSCQYKTARPVLGSTLGAGAMGAAGAVAMGAIELRWVPSW